MNQHKPRQKNEHGRTRISNDLRFERRERNLSRKQVAKIIGMSVHTIDSYERGKRLPKLINALKLQILYRTQLASIYESLYREFTNEIRAAEEIVQAHGKRGGS